MKWVALEDIDLGNGWLLMKGKNFKGYPFKASMFNRYPTMVESSVLPQTFLNTFYASGVKYSGGVAGFDGLVLGNLAKVYNFQTIRVESISYGTLLSDNTFSGIIGLTFAIHNFELQNNFISRINGRCALPPSRCKLKWEIYNGLWIS